MVATTKENISYKYFFSPAEREDNARKLADAQIGKMELEDEKKAVTSEYKARIDGKDSEIKLISRHIIDGYTTKTKYALKQKNYAQKVWEWVDEDTGEVVKTEPLSPKDMQQDIPFPKPKPEPAPEVPREEVTEVDAEDLNNAEPVGGNQPLLEARVLALPVGNDRAGEEEPTAPDPSGEESDDRNEGADFDADTFTPDEQPTKPVKPKKPGKPAKPTRSAKPSRSDRPAQPAPKKSTKPTKPRK